ncbi:hypothetical protein [Candidatus Viridilinea mediisalina]|uniref:Uncharacterized protein n=1 Tax=Candidatus Viridilinea mediisalina TaxID=2024553 RepID=A0A2A6RJ86_9CHLR|nr:hypothetical protein [Candidatus Viridilinea mediisalina]PDW03001.1 hypothetical protein CJ255_11060 [Candidatus Viridilinea mediisalina]
MQTLLPPPPPPDEALAEVFQYTPKDLRANQRGSISERQQERMRARHADSVGLTKGFFTFVAVIGVVGSGLAALNEGIPLWQMWLAVLIGLLCWSGLAWIILAYSHRRMEQTIAAGEVAQISGTLHLKREGHKPTLHYFCVGGRCFSIDANDHYKLERSRVGGQRATVYYTARWEWVLAVEL